jgi:hypothetical protein
MNRSLPLSSEGVVTMTTPFKPKTTPIEMQNISFCSIFMLMLDILSDFLLVARVSWVKFLANTCCFGEAIDATRETT